MTHLKLTEVSNIICVVWILFWGNLQSTENNVSEDAVIKNINRNALNK